MDSLHKLNYMSMFKGGVLAYQATLPTLKRYIVWMLLNIYASMT